MIDLLDLDDTAWPEPDPQSPKFGDNEFGLKFVCVPAQRKGKDTIALLGSYRLPGHFNAVYGSRIDGALRVVAIHPPTGRVYNNMAEGGHVAPLADEMRPYPGPEPWGPGVEMHAIAGHFNVDLRAHLGLENAAADYVVFAWVDDVVSAVQVVNVPVPAKTSNFVPTAAPLPGLQFRKLAVSPAAKGPITIEVQPDGAIPMEIGPHLVGTLADDLLPAKGGPPAGSAKITFMGLTYLKREFRAASPDFPPDAIDSRIPHFDMPLKNLVNLTTNSPKGADKGFLLVCVGKAVSKVAVAKP